MSGIVYVELVYPRENEASSVYEALVLLEAAKGIAIDARLKLWADAEKGIYDPVMGAVYQLEA